MSKDHEGDIKRYILLSESWYADATLKDREFVDQVTFGFYSPEGGASGEMSMCWIDLEGKSPSPQLRCFNDAWHTLAQFRDVIDEMADVDDQDITPRQFCALLDRCGFVDATPKEYTR